jgi:uncharacterized membrane protein YphA (DoxX/SURF4 family)
VSSTGVGYAAAVALAAIFAIAAVAKLRDVSATERDFAGLGIPRASFFARFVPIAELSIVALLLIVPPAGAIAALVSLAFFTTFLIGRLRAGVRAPCACFGSSRAQPISVRDVIRNLLLMALAVVSLATDRPTTIAPLDALAVLAVIAAAGGALHLAGRVRSQ